ncbi:MAG: DNA double-strand break repair nuclease NurA, partial [Candidatus Hodarchaeales archaeon]
MLFNLKNCINVAKNQEKEISKNFPDVNFPKIKKIPRITKENVQEMIAIDGTSLWLWKHAVLDLWLVLNRTVAVRYTITGEKVKGRNIFIDDVPIIFSTLPGKNGTVDPSLHEELLNFKMESGREHIIIAQGFREVAEYSLAIKMTKKYPETIIALDGNLNTYKTPTFQTIMNDLSDSVQRNDCNLVGIVKSNKTHRFSSLERDETFLARITSQKKDLLYTELPEDPNHLNPKYYRIGSSYLVKLHPNANKWFRIDIGNSTGNFEKVLSDLASYSCTQELLGYPLPLIDAHQGCISIHKMKDDYL